MSAEVDDQRADAWRFEPIARTYLNGKEVGVRLTDPYNGDSSATDRIALMLAVVLPGVRMRRVLDMEVQLVIELGTYYQKSLQHVSAGLLNQLLAKLASPHVVAGIRRHPTLPMVWLLLFNGIRVQLDHQRALMGIDIVMGASVSPAAVYDGQVFELYVPALGVHSEDGDDAASAELLAGIRAIFDFNFEPPKVEAETEEGKGAEHLPTPISAPPAPAQES